MITANITGRDTVLRNLNREVAGMKNRTRAGIRMALLFIKGVSMPRTPYVTGKLRGSTYTEVVDTSSGPVGEVGYAVAYAGIVHEKESTRSGEPKFLENPMKENVKQIIQIIEIATSLSKKRTGWL